MPNDFMVKIQTFFKNFGENLKKATIQEKVAYSMIGVGFIFIILSIILF